MRLTFDKFVVLLGVLTPLAGISGAAAWTIYKEVRDTLKGKQVTVQQGQTVTVEAVTLLHSDKDYHRARAEAYRDWILRQDLDPSLALIDAGLMPKPPPD